MKPGFRKDGEKRINHLVEIVLKNQVGFCRKLSRIVQNFMQNRAQLFLKKGNFVSDTCARFFLAKMQCKILIFVQDRA